MARKYLKSPRNFEMALMSKEIRTRWLTLLKILTVKFTQIFLKILLRNNS